MDVNCIVSKACLATNSQHSLQGQSGKVLLDDYPNARRVVPKAGAFAYVLLQESLVINQCAPNSNEIKYTYTLL